MIPSEEKLMRAEMLSGLGDVLRSWWSTSAMNVRRSGRFTIPRLSVVGLNENPQSHDPRGFLRLTAQAAFLVFACLRA